MRRSALALLDVKMSTPWGFTVGVVFCAVAAGSGELLTLAGELDEADDDDTPDPFVEEPFLEESESMPDSELVDTLGEEVSSEVESE